VRNYLDIKRYILQHKSLCWGGGLFSGPLFLGPRPWVGGSRHDPFKKQPEPPPSLLVEGWVRRALFGAEGSGGVDRTVVEQSVAAQISVCLR